MEKSEIPAAFKISKFGFMADPDLELRILTWDHDERSGLSKTDVIEVF